MFGIHQKILNTASAIPLFLFPGFSNNSFEKKQQPLAAFPNSSVKIQKMCQPIKIKN
jgi:hypothetical protein